MTNFNERKNTFIYKNIISYTLFSKGWWLLCVRDELETGTDSYIDSAVLLSHLGWVAQPWVTEGPLSAAGSQFGILSPTDCFSKSSNSQPIASRHAVIHTPVPFPIWGLLWQLWLSYPLRASVDCTQCLCTWTKSWIVQRPTKLNDKI